MTATRRDFVLRATPAFALYALLGECALGARASGNVDGWIRRHDALAKALAAGELEPVAWQSEVEYLAAAIDVSALAEHVARAEQRDAGKGMPTDPAKRLVTFRDAAGERANAHYGAALFAFDAGNVITPHAHRHMASAHLVLEGTLRVRNYDRAGESDGELLLRPTRDYEARPGAISTMTSARDNVHWFVPRTKTATTFDVVVSDLTPGAPSYVIEPVDPLGAERLADGTLRAKIVSFAESSAKYTAEV